MRVLAQYTSCVPYAFEDSPTEWSWDCVDKESDEKLDSDRKDKKDTTQGRGKDKAKGRGKGKKGPSPQNTELANGKAKAKAKSPFMLSNLVRAGNQMGNASSWRIVIGSVKSIVESKLKLQPLSEATEESRDHLRKNTRVLHMLGKLRNVETCKLQPSQALVDSAEELQVSWLPNVK